MKRLNLFLCLCALAAITPAVAQEIILQPHRAIYELSLGPGKGRNSLSSASGKIVYEFTGNACEGYSTKTQFITALQSQDGTAQMTDVSSATFESADGKEMRFVTGTKANGLLKDVADGIARKQGDGTLNVSLTRPKKESLKFGSGILFPAQHSLKMLSNAKSGEVVFHADLFDGSEGARKVYTTTGVIGSDAKNEIPANSLGAEMAGLPRYKISLFFFDASADPASEQSALYEINSVMFDNGITYSMRLNYPEFSLEAKLQSLELLPASKCK